MADRRRRSSSPLRRRGGGETSGGDRELVIQRVVREGNNQYPLLTKTNYYGWAALMKLKLQARSLWTAANVGTDNFVDDRNALEAIALGVPPEMQGSIASKPTAKEAWDSLKKTHLGVDRVRQARANTLRRAFEDIKFKDGESVDDFGVRIRDLANQLEVLDAGYTEAEQVRKFLQATPPKYQQIVMAIETLLDLDTLSVEDLIGRLKAAEERFGLNGGGGGTMASLNLTEDELVARVMARLHLSGEGSSGGGKGSSNQRRGRGESRGRDGGGGSGGKAPSGANGGKKKKRLASDECAYCGKTGHWARECRKKKRDEAAHAAQAEEEPREGALMLAMCVEGEADVITFPTSPPPLEPAAPPTEDGLSVLIQGGGATRWTLVGAEEEPAAHVALATATAVENPPTSSPAREEIRLREDKLFVQLGEKGDGGSTRWILDTGATNHMTGMRSAFTELDSGIRGSVRFGDGSVVAIEGRGTILFKCKGGEH